MGVSLVPSSIRSRLRRSLGVEGLPLAGWLKTTHPSTSSAVLDAAVAALEAALHAKDPDTMVHSARVRCIAEAMARQLGLRQSVVCDMAIAAQLHDIGKIGVPDELLHK